MLECGADRSQYIIDLSALYVIHLKERIGVVYVLSYNALDTKSYLRYNT